MSFMQILGGLVAVGLLIYLVVAMINAEDL